MGIKEEFSPSKLKFTGIERSRFYTPVFKCIPHNARWIVQGFCAIYSSVLMATSLIHSVIEYKSAKWFKFLTSWNYMLCTTYFITAFIVNLKNGKTFKKFIAIATSESAAELIPKNDSKAGNEIEIGVSSTKVQDDETEETAHEEKFYWLLHSIAHVVCPIVVIIYWAFLSKAHNYSEVNLDTFLHIDRHTIVYGLLLLEYVFHDIPFRIPHVVYPIVFVLVYIIFNVIYWAVTGDVIYPVLDWSKKPGLSVAFILIFAVVGVAIQVLLFLVDLGKKKLSTIKSCQ